MDSVNLRRKKTKEFRCFSCQLEKMRERNLEIDIDDPISLLKNINYYRLTGYLVGYKLKDDRYKNGTQLTSILNLYDIDSKLRKIFFQLLEDVEVKIRTALSYTLARNYGPMCYMDKATFSSNYKYKKFINEILPTRKKYSANKAFIRHHEYVYGGDLPIWVVTEILAFESLSVWYKNLHRCDANYIGVNLIKVNPSLLRKWFDPINDLRNECAHHHKLLIPRNSPIEVEKKYERQNYYIERKSNFAYALACKSILHKNSKWENFVTSIEELVEEYNCSPEVILFPTNWKQIAKI